MTDEDAVTDLVSAQLDELLGPVPQTVETQEWRLPQENGASERRQREFEIFYGA